MGFFERNREKTQEQLKEDKFFEALRLMRKRSLSEKTKGYEIIREIAESGDVRAQVIAAQFCDYALHDPKQAYEWLKPALEKNDLQARYYYAGMLLRGEPVKKNKKMAIEEFRKLADEGVAEAMFVLGQMEEEAGNIEGAMEWYHKAYENGYAPVQKHLRMMKKKGIIESYDLKANRKEK